MIKVFRVVHQNPNHWDIYDDDKRIYKIRGEKGKIGIYSVDGILLVLGGFKTVTACMAYLCDILMYEE